MYLSPIITTFDYCLIFADSVFKFSGILLTDSQKPPFPLRHLTTVWFLDTQCSNFVNCYWWTARRRLLCVPWTHNRRKFYWLMARLLLEVLSVICHISIIKCFGGFAEAIPVRVRKQGDVLRCTYLLALLHLITVWSLETDCSNFVDVYWWTARHLQ